MSSDQLTYVLIALVVTGLAILLLLAGVLVARRGRVETRPAAPTPPPMEAEHRDRVAAAAPVAAPAPAVVGPPRMTDTGAPAAPEPVRPPVAVRIEPEAAEEAPAVTVEDRAAAARRLQDPREEEIIEGFLSVAPRRRESAFAAPGAPTASVPPAGATAPSQAGRSTVAAPVPADAYVDEATGLESRAAWERDLAEENARYVRYRRPVGLVVAELDGLARFEGQFGPDAAKRILAAVGGAMRLTARRTDRVAHVGGGRFMVLLPETDEIQAINYVERVRSECERWLEAGAVALHIALGWASPTAVGELDTALRTAEERMYAERRRSARAGSGEPDAPR